MVLHVLAGAAALEVAGRAGEEADLVDREQDLVVDEARARLAGVLRLEVGELVGARLHRVGDAEQRELALGRGRLAPLSNAVAAAAKAASTSRRAGHRRGAVDLLGRRVDDVEVPSRRRG